MIRPEARDDSDLGAVRAEREVRARQLDHHPLLPAEPCRQRLLRPEVRGGTFRGQQHVDTGEAKKVRGEESRGRLSSRSRHRQRAPAGPLENGVGETRQNRSALTRGSDLGRHLGRPHIDEDDVGHTEIHSIAGVKIRPFEIERYYERWEFAVELMLSSSDCESRPLGDLLALEPDAEDRLRSLHLGYTEVPGSQELREAIAGRYDQVQPAEVLALAAAEEGIFAVNHALLGPGDHAVVETPCYGSALELARSTGAEVSTWERRYTDRWAHDLDELERLVRPATKLLYVNTPHNPTGTQMRRDVFDGVIELARARGLVLLCDEVYRELEHDVADRLPAAADLYERAFSLGTVSKAHGLPGLRIGWLACRDPELLEQVKEMKLYTTICSSAPSELLVAIALRHADELVGRNRELVLRNLPLLDDFLERRSDLFSWMRPPRARSASRASSSRAMSVSGASGSRQRPVCCYCPARSTMQPRNRFGLAGYTCRTRSPGSTSTSLGALGA